MLMRARANWGKYAGGTVAALVWVGIIGTCTAIALFGVAATVTAWQFFRLVVGF